MLASRLRAAGCKQLFGIELLMLPIRESPNAGFENCTKIRPAVLEAGAGKAVRDAVTRMHIRRNMIAWPATEPTNPKRPKSWALVFSKRAIYGSTGESGKHTDTFGRREKGARQRKDW